MGQGQSDTGNYVASGLRGRQLGFGVEMLRIVTPNRHRGSEY